MKKMPENVCIAFSLTLDSKKEGRGQWKKAKHSNAYIPIMLATVHTHAKENNCIALG